MEMNEARDIAVRFLGGLAVSDDEVFQAGNTIRASLRENGLVNDDLDMPAEMAGLEARDDELDNVRVML